MLYSILTVREIITCGTAQSAWAGSQGRQQEQSHLSD
jgi:hypothetical protein